jgi:hypothetical protein
MSGVIGGGWEFVTAAYSVSALLFIGYTASVLLRYRGERRRAAREGTGR